MVSCCCDTFCCTMRRNHQLICVEAFTNQLICVEAVTNKHHCETKYCVCCLNCSFQCGVAPFMTLAIPKSIFSSSVNSQSSKSSRVTSPLLLWLKKFVCCFRERKLNNCFVVSHGVIIIYMFGCCCSWPTI